MRFRNARGPSTLADLPGDTLSEIAAFEGTNRLNKINSGAWNQMGHQQAVYLIRHDNIDEILTMPDKQLEGLQDFKIMNYDGVIASGLCEFVRLPSVKNLSIEFHMPHMREEFGDGGLSYESNKVNIAMKKAFAILAL
jgi:hypothetical protein